MDNFSADLETCAEKIISKQPVTELEALRLAFNESVKNGKLVDYYEYSYVAGKKSQLFIYSIINGYKNNTVACSCFKAKYINSSEEILISEYADLYRKVLSNLEHRADVPQNMKEKIIICLNSEFRRVSTNYINNFRSKLVQRARRVLLDRVNDRNAYFDYCYSCYNKLSEGLQRLGVKELVIYTALSGNRFQGEFFILDDPMMIVHRYTLGETACRFSEMTAFRDYQL